MPSCYSPLLACYSSSMHAHGTASCAGPDLARYRDAVADLLIEIASHTGPEDLAKAEKVLTERLADAEFAPVLAASPEGCPAAVDRLLREVRHYQPDARNCAADLTAHIRIHLFALIDVMWWGSTRAFVTDSDLLHSAELADLEPLRRRGELHFRYRRQARTLPLRAVRAADRRLRPGPHPAHRGPALRPGPAGSGHPAQPAGRRLRRAPRRRHPRCGSPAWPGASSTSAGCARSGTRPPCPARTASATRWTSRCPGSAGSARAGVLEGLLLERQRAGEVNAIDEGQTWHLCLSPAA